MDGQTAKRTRTELFPRSGAWRGNSVGLLLSEAKSMSITFPILSWITFAPLIGAFVVTLLPKENGQLIKMVSLLASLVVLALSVMVWLKFDPSGGLMFEERFA